MPVSHCVPSVVGDADGECLARVVILHAAVLRQEVFAAALEVEDLAVESLVVRIAEDGTDALADGRRLGDGGAGRAALA